MSKETTQKHSQSVKTKTPSKGRTQVKAKAHAKAKARKRQKMKLMITGILAVVLIVICAAAIFVLGGFGTTAAKYDSIYTSSLRKLVIVYVLKPILI